MNKLKKFDRAISFQRVFVELTGSVTGALLLSQAVYWQQRCKSEDGWWWKTFEDWQEETGLTKNELLGARKACAEYLSFKAAGIPCRSHWRVNAEAIDNQVRLLEEQTSTPETGELGIAVTGKPASQFAEKRLTTKEETSKETTEALALKSETEQPQKQKSQKREFTDLWCAEFKKKHGWAYKFQHAKDGQAADRLLSTGMDPTDLMCIAKSAWNNPNGWWCKYASTLAGFDSHYNNIRHELSNPPGQKPRPDIRQFKSGNF